MFGLDTGLTILLIFCLIAACAFEFINGFHDTANAVATVIYTNAMKPKIAVIWSGLWNFIGVYVGGIAVAIGIVNLLPIDMLVDANIYHGVAMILALILTAIIWNLWTWYLGIPCSSSHTLIGSIFGVGLAYMLIPGTKDVALNWSKVGDVGLSLLISPVFGFGLALLLMYLLKFLIRRKDIFDEPRKKLAPPFWIRSILILTCTSVSFSHGSNDGQKGVGLIMIILIGIVPALFAIDTSRNPSDLLSKVRQSEMIITKVDSTRLSAADLVSFHTVTAKLADMDKTLSQMSKFKANSGKVTFELRRDILVLSKKTDEIIKHNNGTLPGNISADEMDKFQAAIKGTRSFTEYAPWWVILMVSVSLGIGTMVGWKQIVVTVGEKIGKTQMTYAQGASAQLVASSTIIASTFLGLPVSTTHVLSSGVAGTMVASDGLKNLQMKTLKNMLIAWVVTLPITILLSGFLFMLLRLFMGQ
jgi:low-affinity inorganic phosphate transporter